jgi:hypothetical protein
MEDCDLTYGILTPVEWCKGKKLGKLLAGTFHPQKVHIKY